MYQIDFHKPLPYSFHRYRRHQHERPCRNPSGKKILNFRFRCQIQSADPHTGRTGRCDLLRTARFQHQDDVDVVVYTAAIHPDNPEFACAKEKGLPMLTRAELLGQIMRNYDTPIAISGTHGKTTTTSMVSHILLEGDCDPTISVGGILPAIHGNIRVGNSETFVTEACEYTNSFLSFFPEDQYDPEHGCRSSGFLQGH